MCHWRNAANVLVSPRDQTQLSSTVPVLVGVHARIIGEVGGRPRFVGVLVVAALSVAASPAQGATVAVATGDDLTLLDADHGSFQRVIPLGLRTRAVAVSPDGRLAFVVGDRRLIKVDLASGESLQIVAMADLARSVAVSDDGGSVLVGRQGAIDMFATDTLRPIGRIGLGQRDARFLTVRGSRGISVGSDGRLLVLDLTRRLVLARPAFRRVGGAAFTPGGRHVRVVVGGARPVLRTLSAPSGTATARTMTSGGATGGLALSCDGHHAYVAPGPTGHSLVSVDLRTARVEERVRTLTGPFTPVLGVGNHVHLAGGPIFTNYVPSYITQPSQRKAPAFALGEGQKPYGLAVTPPPCSTQTVGS